MSSGRALVTGGSGFLGSALVKKMLAGGWTVRVLDDYSRGRPRRLADVEDDVELVQGDVRDYETVYKAAEGVDTMVHLAYINGTEFFYQKPQLILEVGVKGALNTLDVAVARGIRRYWTMSSSEVYQRAAVVPTPEEVSLAVPDVMNPRYSYGGGKIISELLAVNYGRAFFDSVAIVRPHNVYGADMGFEHVIPQFLMRAALLDESVEQSQPLSFSIRGDGSQTRSFVFIDDFIEGCYLAFSQGTPAEETGCSIYHVGTTEQLSIRELASQVMSLFDREGVVVPSQAPSGETDRRCPSIEKIAALGYHPRVSLQEGLRQTKQWYIENRHLWPSPDEGFVYGADRGLG